MKKFLVFISFLANVVFIGGIVFFTLIPTGKKMLKDYASTIKVDTVETVEDTKNTEDTEPEKNGFGITKEVSIEKLKILYKSYQAALARNSAKGMNNSAISYNNLVDESKKCWKDFASLMEANNLPNALAEVEVE